MVRVNDDDPSVARLVAGLLRAGGEYGASVRSAFALVDGLTEAARRRPAAVFLDLTLPDAKGLSKRQIAELLRNSPRPVEWHVSNIIREVGLHDRVEGTRSAIRERFVMA